MPGTPKRWALGCLRASGLFLLLAAILILLFYLEEDWRGARQLAAAKAKWQSAGYSLNPGDYVPPPVPDAKNLAALPVFQMEPDPKSDNKFFPTRLNDAISETTHGGDLSDYEHKKDLPTLVSEAYAKMFPGKTPPPSSSSSSKRFTPSSPTSARRRKRDRNFACNRITNLSRCGNGHSG